MSSWSIKLSMESGFGVTNMRKALYKIVVGSRFGSTQGEHSNGRMGRKSGVAKKY